jgi:hypothetical protein
MAYRGPQPHGTDSSVDYSSAEIQEVATRLRAAEPSLSVQQAWIKAVRWLSAVSSGSY